MILKRLLLQYIRSLVMLNLFKAFTTQENFFYDGAFIAKVKYQRLMNTSDKENYKNEIIKSSNRLCVINSTGYVNNEVAEVLTVYLMINVKLKEAIKPETINHNGTFWRNFTKEEISDFSHITGDMNSIHLSDNPVVQGLFILKELCATAKSNEIEIKYIHPVYGCNPVYITQDKNVINGFSNDILCFQATLS